MNDQNINLDQICMEFGFKFAEQTNEAFKKNPKKAENLLTKALAVLQEQGLYAFLLFCESRGGSEKDPAGKIKELTVELLKDKLGYITDKDIFREIKENLAMDIYKLMLSIQVLEKSLIYARFHAKAMQK